MAYPMLAGTRNVIGRLYERYGVIVWLGRVGSGSSQLRIRADYAEIIFTSWNYQSGCRCRQKDNLYLFLKKL